MWAPYPDKNIPAAQPAGLTAEKSAALTEQDASEKAEDITDCTYYINLAVEEKKLNEQQKDNYRKGCTSDNKPERKQAIDELEKLLGVADGAKPETNIQKNPVSASPAIEWKGDMVDFYKRADEFTKNKKTIASMEDWYKSAKISGKVIGTKPTCTATVIEYAGCSITSGSIINLSTALNATAAKIEIPYFLDGSSEGINLEGGLKDQHGREYIRSILNTQDNDADIKNNLQELSGVSPASIILKTDSGHMRCGLDNKPRKAPIAFWYDNAGQFVISTYSFIAKCHTGELIQKSGERPKEQ